MLEKALIELGKKKVQLKIQGEKSLQNYLKMLIKLNTKVLYAFKLKPIRLEFKNEFGRRMLFQKDEEWTRCKSNKM